MDIVPHPPFPDEGAREEGPPPLSLPRARRQGSIPAWREWRVVRHRQSGEYAAGSLWVPEVWEGPLVHAPAPPADENATLSPGIYAWKPEHARPSRIGFPLRGRVRLFGRVVAHERGYRAEHARIEDLELLYTPGAIPARSSSRGCCTIPTRKSAS